MCGPHRGAGEGWDTKSRDVLTAFGGEATSPSLSEKRLMGKARRWPLVAQVLASSARACSPSSALSASLSRLQPGSLDKNLWPERLSGVPRSDLHPERKKRGERMPRRLGAVLLPEPQEGDRPAPADACSCTSTARKSAEHRASSCWWGRGSGTWAVRWASRPLLLQATCRRPEGLRRPPPGGETRGGLQIRSLSVQWGCNCPTS